MKSFTAPIVLCLATFALSAPTGNPTRAGSTLQSEPAAKPEVNRAKDFDPDAALKKLYPYWRKYGPWDYKQQGSKYLDFTNFNFGATGRAAGFSEEALLALANRSHPSMEDILALDDPELVAGFVRNAGPLEKLREMAEEDSAVIRIARDYTGPIADARSPLANTNLPQPRWDEYRSAFEKLDLVEGMVRTEDYPKAIFFIARSKGLCTGGTSAGYVHSGTALSPVVYSPGQALVEIARKKSSQGGIYYVFQALKSEWYAFYEADW